eukprot:SAG11_NODE_75_length_18024_cov_5.885356_10_plen_142_part_00
MYTRGRANEYAFAHEFDDSVGLAALGEYGGNGRKLVVGSGAPTDPGRQGADGVRGSIVGDAGGGFAAGADSSGALEDPAFAEAVGEEEEEMWIRALEALEEDENLELERAELDELMSERASSHTIPEDLELDKRVCENNQK